MTPQKIVYSRFVCETFVFQNCEGINLYCTPGNLWPPRVTATLGNLDTGKNPLKESEEANSILGWAVKQSVSQTLVPFCGIILEIRSDDLYKVSGLVSTVKEACFIMEKGALPFS